MVLQTLVSVVRNPNLPAGNWKCSNIKCDASEVHLLSVGPRGIATFTHETAQIASTSQPALPASQGGLWGIFLPIHILLLETFILKKRLAC